MRISHSTKSKCGGWHGAECFRPKKCAACGKLFKPKAGPQLVCSKKCGLTRLRGLQNTERQYERISNNWSRYFLRLVANSRRQKKFGSNNLTRDFLLKLLKRQRGKCAISGVHLTCKLKKGVSFLSNASIDRKDVFRGYTRDNIHLVCVCINHWRATTPLNKFIWWCKQIAKHNSQV